MKWNIELLANVFGLFGFLVRLAEPELVGGVPVLHEHANDLVTLSLQQDCGHCKGTKICLSKNVFFSLKSKSIQVKILMHVSKIYN